MSGLSLYFLAFLDWLPAMCPHPKITLPPPPKGVTLASPPLEHVSLLEHVTWVYCIEGGASKSPLRCLWMDQWVPQLTLPGPPPCTQLQTVLGERGQRLNSLPFLTSGLFVFPVQQLCRVEISTKGQTSSLG